MKFFKNLLLITLMVLTFFLMPKLVLDAWDNTMTDEEIAYYLEKYPTEEKLIKLAERRNIVVEKE